jgi:hypothetical protein
MFRPVASTQLANLSRLRRCPPCLEIGESIFLDSQNECSECGHVIPRDALQSAITKCNDFPLSITRFPWGVAVQDTRDRLKAFLSAGLGDDSFRDTAPCIEYFGRRCDDITSQLEDGVKHELAEQVEDVCSALNVLLPRSVLPQPQN